MQKNYIIVLIFILLANKVKAQEIPLMENMRIEINKFNINSFYHFGKQKKNRDKEKKHIISIKVKILDYTEKQFIDFNNLSLVDKTNKIRYLAFNIHQTNTYHDVYQTRIEKFKREDNFLKYSQDEILNYKQYRNYFTSDSKLPSTEHRFDLESFPAKRKGYIKFEIDFPALKSSKDSGNFLLYWKNEIVGEFSLYKGKVKK